MPADLSEIFYAVDECLKGNSFFLAVLISRLMQETNNNTDQVMKLVICATGASPVLRNIILSGLPPFVAVAISGLDPTKKTLVFCRPVPEPGECVYYEKIKPYLHSMRTFVNDCIYNYHLTNSYADTNWWLTFQPW